MVDLDAGYMAIAGAELVQNDIVDLEWKFRSLRIHGRANYF